MKDKAFARGVHRDELIAGAEALGIPFDEHVRTSAMPEADRTGVGVESMSTRGKPRILLMHYILDPGPAILTEAGDVVPYQPDRPLVTRQHPQAAEGCVGIVKRAVGLIGTTSPASVRMAGPGSRM